MNIKVQIKPQERIGVALKDVIKVNTATGTKVINTNGLYDITEYKYADVFVSEQNLQEKDVIITENGIYEVLPDDKYLLTRVEVDVNVPVPEGYIIPEGVLDISENGEHNVREYEKVKVNVPIPDGYIVPEGTLDISENGEHNVNEYEKVNVNVPIPEGYIVPAGEIQINKEGTYDVTEFKDAVFSVQKTGLQITPTKELQYIQPDQDTFFNEVSVNPIPAEYIVPEGKKEITNTDEIDITNYSSVQVADNNLKPENIAENIEVLGIKGTFKGGIDTSDGTITPDKVLEGAIGYSQEQRIIGTIETYDGSASEDVTPMEDAILSGVTIEEYTNNRVTQIAGYKFRSANIKRFNSTTVNRLGTQTFYGSTLEECNTPNLVNLSDSAVFNDCKLKKAYFPKLTSSIGANIFNGCSELLYAHIGKPSSVSGRAFENCTNLQAVIVDNTSVPSLNSTNTFSNSGISKGIGFIYVQDTLVENFKSATNWSTYASQIKSRSELPQEVKDSLGME